MEQQFVAWLRDRLPAHPLLRLGPGDDAAVLRMAGIEECVITVDLLTEGVDFLLAEIDPRRVGRKALAVNLSDLAAMAARPLAAVLAVALPRIGGHQLAVQLYEGILPLAEKYDLAIAGGDTNSWDGPLVITATLLGQVTARGPLCRKGALAGDRIIVTGAFGGSILERQFDFEPRVNEALLLNQRYELHAGMDVSDGLAIDLSRLIGESGVGAIVETDCVPIHDDARRLARSAAMAARRWNMPWAMARISSCCWPCHPRRPGGCSPSSRWMCPWPTLASLPPSPACGSAGRRPATAVDAIGLGA